ncbi:MAG: SDR family oxidoreductase [Pseudomonadales bacterium]|nr:SDR family oxidoreductase [Pseudomonadales bacterium]
MNLNRFAGQTALITGASSGIGDSFARLLAAAGTHLVLVARRQERLQQLAEHLREKHSINVEVIALDLTSQNAVRSLYEQVQEQGIQIDILINNAGMGKHGDYLDVTLEEHHQMIYLNMIALNDLSYLFAKDMIERSSGYILLVGSIASFVPVPRFATYAATKAYVLSLGGALGKELAPHGIAVTTLCPGGTTTEFMDISGQQIDGIRTLAMMSSESVAKAGLRGLMLKQRVVVPGLLYKLSILSLRLFPRRLQALFGQMATD